MHSGHRPQDPCSGGQTTRLSGSRGCGAGIVFVFFARSARPQARQFSSFASSARSCPQRWHTPCLFFPMPSPPFAASDPGSCSIYLCHNSFVGESGSAELAELAALVRRRNAVEARLAALLERPTGTGWMGEWIAARVFDIELEPSANAAGYDGQFTIGALAG